MFQINRLNLLKLSFLFSLFLFASCSDGAFKKKYNSDIGQIRNIQAQHTASIESLRADIRSISGQVEELQFHALGKTKELEKTIQQLGSRVPPPAGVPEDLLNRDEELIRRQSGEAAELYASGLQKIRTGDFAGSISVFSSFLETNPQTTFSDNAHFWLGKSLEKSGDYGGAIASYSEVYSRFPAEDFVPPALYFMGQAFLKISSIQEAKDTFGKLKDDYRSSPYAKKAADQLKKIRRRR